MAAMPLRSLSVVIPCYNEGSNIEQSVRELHSTLSGHGFEFEIIVVNDGSQDASREILHELTKSYRQLRIIDHPENLGYGQTLITGFKSATSEIIFYTDADLPIPFESIIEVLPHFERVDMVLGFRKTRHDTLRRRVYSLSYNWLIRKLFGVPFVDVNFSFKGFKRDIISNITLDAKTVFIDGQLLVEAFYHGYSWVEVPIDYYPRKCGASSFDALSYAWRTLNEMLAYWRRTHVKSTSRK